jgi:hypothetical protein
MALTKIKTGSVSDSITLTTPDINGGTIDATLIGGTTPAVATFTTASDASGNVRSGRKNFILNGDMRISQRGTSAIPTTNGAVTTCDRFMSEYTSYFTAKAEQVDDSPVGFSKSLKVTCTAVSGSKDANTYLIPFESRMENDLGIATGVGKTGTKPFTISFWIKSNQTGTKMFDVVYNNYSGNRNLSKSYTINSADTWEYKTITFPACTASGSGAATGLKDVSFYWWADAGSTYSGGTEQTAWGTVVAANRAVGVGTNAGVNSYWQITGVQLEVGSVATDFEHRSYGEELLLCKRYYEKCSVEMDYTGDSSAVYMYRSYTIPVEKRVAPTIAVTSSIQYWSNGTPTTISGSNLGLVTTNKYWQVKALAVSAARGIYGGEVSLDAEL